MELKRVGVLTLLIAMPYALYIGYLCLMLQSGLVRLYVPTHGARQLLVVGTQSSGTTQTAAELVHLGLEVRVECTSTHDCTACARVHVMRASVYRGLARMHA